LNNLLDLLHVNIETEIPYFSLF